MASWCPGTSDEVAPDISFPESLRQMCDVPHTADDGQDSGTCAHSIEDEKLKYTTHSNNTLLSFDNQDYIEKIEKFQFCVDTVKKIVRPGCSPEMLNVALSSVSSLVKTLSEISSKQFMHASL